MFSNTTLPGGSLYDPESKIKNFFSNEDFEYIRLAVVRDGIPFKDPNFTYPLGDKKEWKRPEESSNPYFIKDRPDRFDAIQGYVKDCWLVAAMEALTLNGNLIKHVVPPYQSIKGDKYYGAFHFRIWRLGTWFEVVVDDRLPVWKINQKPWAVRSRSGDGFWACLLEKAYAKMSGNSYENLNSGHPGQGLQDFSGGIVERIITTKPPAGIAIRWLIGNVFENGALMCCSCFKNVQDVRTELFDQHSYSITNVFKCEDDDPAYPGLYLLRIMNPHGRNEWEGEWCDDFIRWREIDRDIRLKLEIKSETDGEFWMGQEDFIKYFEKLTVCHLGPGQYERSRKREEVVDTWKTTTFRGEWVTGISAGGSDRSTRHQNPQYIIGFGLVEDDSNTDGYTSVVIELTQRSKEDSERGLKRNIRFYVYSLNNQGDLPTPLDYEFFLNNMALNEYNEAFEALIFRSFSTRMTFRPGKYCIVPCTEFENKDQLFLLRIWSESLVQTWEYDTQISKSLPNKEEYLCRTDDGLKEMFYDLADSQDEIDWDRNVGR